MVMYLPICININNKKILIIGGGDIALQKIELLKQFTNNIVVIASKVSLKIKNIGCEYYERDYDASCLKGYFLVYACTNNRKLNKEIKEDANKLGLLVNVVDDSQLCDFISPAIYKKGEMIVAVSSGGQNVLKSSRWRNKIKKIFGK